MGKIEECESDSEPGDVRPHIVDFISLDEFSPKCLLNIEVIVVH